MKADQIAAWNPAELYLSNLSIDCVIVGYHEKQLKILCTRFEGLNGWLLPGGFIGKNENLDDAALRVLAERTGVEGLFLKQFHTFGSLQRSWEHPENKKQLVSYEGVSAETVKWMTERFVSVGYYALTEYSKVNPKAIEIENECRWFDVNELPHLLLDHAQMVEMALRTLQLQLHYEPIGFNLLPEKFTLPEMQALYETILGKELDQRNFTKKLLSLGIIKKLNEKKHIGGHRSPSLYKFIKRNYNKALKEGVQLAF